jgi:hypothetical protein
VRGSSAGKVTAIDQCDPTAAHRGVARDRGAIDSAADDREVNALAGKTRDLPLANQRGCLRVANLRDLT